MQSNDMCSTDEGGWRTDAAIMGLLLERSTPWAVDELVREVGDSIDASDSLARLVGGGLVHRLAGDFVIASRTAELASSMDL
jgi:hypothetical protein